MKEQTRAEPRFSLCGLNCGLCPMYHISETEHCTGCGGRRPRTPPSGKRARWPRGCCRRPRRQTAYV